MVRADNFAFAFNQIVFQKNQKIGFPTGNVYAGFTGPIIFSGLNFHEKNVAVLIVNWKSSAVLLRCLECIVQQESGETDIFVLDNSQDDPLAEVYCGRFPAVQFYKSGENIGFAAGNNLLFQKTKGHEWIALVNPDAFLETGLVKRNALCCRCLS